MTEIPAGPNRKQKKIGDCEFCNNTNIEIYLHYGNLWLCPTCSENEKKASDERMKPENQEKRVQQMYETARKVDSTIELKSDIYNAATVSIKEIRDSIYAESLSPEDKAFKVAEILSERIKAFSKAIFDKRQELVTLQTEERAFQQALTDEIKQVRADRRKEIQASDLQYTPTPPKTIKPPKTAGPSKSSKKYTEDCIRWATHYKVPVNVVQMMANSRNESPELLAKELATNLGLIK